VLHSPPPSGATMAFVRSIGRWTMTALVINGIIGAGIFALPGELSRLLGRASPFAMIFAAVAMGIIMPCIAEVASQFSEPGGAYLYTGAASGRSLGWKFVGSFLLALVVEVGVVPVHLVDYPRPSFP